MTTPTAHSNRTCLFCQGTTDLQWHDCVSNICRDCEQARVKSYTTWHRMSNDKGWGAPKSAQK